MHMSAKNADQWMRLTYIWGSGDFTVFAKEGVVASRISFRKGGVPDFRSGDRCLR